MRPTPPDQPIESREQLIYLLTEAAELEHMLTCSYLFAAFSLKARRDEGLLADELEAVSRWQRDVTAIAVEEMLHLALVNNLLTAIGGPPHFERPNFPRASRFYPSNFLIALTPLDLETLQHFVFIERPEDRPEEDAPGFREVSNAIAAAPAGLAPAEPPEHGLMPEVLPYTTVGSLYRGIEAGLRRLAADLGEHRLFIGPARHQVSSAHLHFRGLHAVTTLRSALNTIEMIVRQGEGPRGDLQDTTTAASARSRASFRPSCAAGPASPRRGPSFPIPPPAYRRTATASTSWTTPTPSPPTTFSTPRTN